MIEQDSEEVEIAILNIIWSMMQKTMALKDDDVEYERLRRNGQSRQESLNSLNAPTSGRASRWIYGTRRRSTYGRG